MQKNKWWLSGLTLALAGTLLWANVGWAQGRGGGGRGGPNCPYYQNSQDTRQGWGQGNTNCPNYPGFRNRGQGRGQNAQGQGPRGPRGRGQNAQANTDTNTGQ